MLDIHSQTITPGAVLVLGANGAISVNDGCSGLGVPISPDATLVGWGVESVLANGIARMKLSSQDLPDPVNGEDIAFAATNIVSLIFKYDNLKYKSGGRVITAGTNTAQTICSAITLDAYPGGPCIQGSVKMPNQVIVATATTAGAALVANAWAGTAFAPVAALPAGKYAILGAVCAAVTHGAVRFSHADFGGKKPGFPMTETGVAANLAGASKSDLFLEPGVQFITIGEELGIPCCPVFTVSGMGTGLVIELMSPTIATPTVVLWLAKVG